MRFFYGEGPNTRLFWYQVPSGTFGLLQFRLPRTLGNNLLHFSWTLATADNIFRLAWQPNKPCLASRPRTLAICSFPDWYLSRGHFSIFQIQQPKGKKKALKGRKKRTAEKPQGASIESKTSTAQWQLGERDASKMPCAPEQENDPNKEHKAVNWVHKGRMEALKQSFWGHGIGVSAVMSAWPSKRGLSPVLRSAGPGQGQAAPDFPSARAAALPSTALGGRESPGLCLARKLLGY